MILAWLACSPSVPPALPPEVPLVPEARSWWRVLGEDPWTGDDGTSWSIEAGEHEGGSGVGSTSATLVIGSQARIAYKASAYQRGLGDMEYFGVRAVQPLVSDGPQPNWLVLDDLREHHLDNSECAPVHVAVCAAVPGWEWYPGPAEGCVDHGWTVAARADSAQGETLGDRLVEMAPLAPTPDEVDCTGWSDDHDLPDAQLHLRWPGVHWLLPVPGNDLSWAGWHSTSEWAEPSSPTEDIATNDIGVGDWTLRHDVVSSGDEGSLQLRIRAGRTADGVTEWSSELLGGRPWRAPALGAPFAADDGWWVSATSGNPWDETGGSHVLVHLPAEGQASITDFAGREQTEEGQIRSRERRWPVLDRDEGVVGWLLLLERKDGFYDELLGCPPEKRDETAHIAWCPGSDPDLDSPGGCTVVEFLATDAVRAVPHPPISMSDLERQLQTLRCARVLEPDEAWYH